MFSRFLLSFLVFSGLFWQAAAPAQAALIVENTAGTQVTAGSGLWGQSFTTPTGGTWNSIKFNFFNGSNAPVAAGGLYALSQSYAGAPNALSSSTPGFLGFTNVISGGQWQFSGLTLNANTQYFFYMDGEITEFVKFAFTNPYAGGQGFSSLGSSANYIVPPSFDLNFSVQGNAAAVPEPSSVAFFSLVAGGVGLRRWRSRSRKPSACPA